MYISGKAEVRKAIVAKILGLQHNLGGNIFPRVELTDIYESEVQDKCDDVREVSLFVESLSNTSYQEAVTMTNSISSAICGTDTLLMEGWRAVDTIMVQSSDLTEVGEADIIIHRIRTNYRIILTLK